MSQVGLESLIYLRKIYLQRNTAHLVKYFMLKIINYRNRRNSNRNES